MRQSIGFIFCIFLTYNQPLYGQVNPPLTVSVHNLSNLAFGVSGDFDFLPWSGPDTSNVKADEISYSLHWDNRKFNPYDEDDVVYPFRIDFDKRSYALPINRKMVITSRYGWRNGELHRGIDLDLVTGDEVYALMDGKVRYVRYHAGHGKTVVVRHSNGLETVYAHLSKQLVQENDVVQKGQLLGKGGTTGNARGSHLHLEVRYRGVTLNPEYFFDFQYGDKVRSLSSWVTKDYADPRNYSSTRSSSLPIISEIPTKQKPAKKVSDKKIASVASINNLTLSLQEDNETTKTKTIEPAAKSELYTIRYGDTLYSLARKHQTTVEDICRVNGIEDSFKIRVGQQIVLDF